MAKLVDESGTTVFEGTAEGIGGSQAGILQSVQVLFTETAGAGMYEAQIAVEAGTIVLDVMLYILAAFAADTADFTMGDSGHAHAYFDAFNALRDVYNPLNPDSTYDLQTRGDTYSGAAYNFFDPLTGSLGIGVRYATSDTLTLTLVTTGAGGTTGRFLVTLLTLTPLTPTAAVKS